MRDDFIQGILFSRSDLIDLRRMSRSERQMYKMLATKNTLRDWSSQPLADHADQTSDLPGGTIITPSISVRFKS